MEVVLFLIRYQTRDDAVLPFRTWMNFVDLDR